MTKTHPIIFNTWSIQRILAGEKVQTRRVIKDKTLRIIDRWIELSRQHDKRGYWDGYHGTVNAARIRCPYGIIGDHLWVRETHLLDPPQDDTWDHGDGTFRAADVPTCYQIPKHVLYKADPRWQHKNWKWRPSIFTPKWGARIWLEMTGVKIEQVKDISWKDAIAEGVHIHPPASCSVAMFSIGAQEKIPCWCDSPVGTFSMLWDKINKHRGFSWDFNPWVFAISFKVLSIGGKL